MITSSVSASEFPVPADLAGYWMFDQVHAPQPLTPLSQEILVSALTEGFCAALREVGYPLGLFYRTVNYYLYGALLPWDAKPHAGGQTAPDQEAIASLLRRLGERWEREWLPSILTGIHRLRTLDYDSLPDDQLLTVLDDLRRDLVARWRIHGFLLFNYQAASMFEDFYCAILNPEDPTEPYLLLNGFTTRAFDANQGLWRLSRRVRNSAELLRLFEQPEPSAIAVGLQRSGDGRATMEELRAHLEEYGWRSDSIMELAEPAWREDLTIPLNSLRGLIALDDAKDPHNRLRWIAARREKLLAEARTRLEGDPKKRTRFDALYEQARFQVILDEDHNFYIDQMGNVALRLPILELGRRLVRRCVLAQVDDVFLLTTADIRSGLAGVDHHDLVAARRAEMVHWANVTPPPSLGEPPTEDEIDPFIAALIKLDAPPSKQEQTATMIKGTPASPGTACGRAKVARSLEEASTVEPGQILVCEMTLPPWSALFSTISAVVADTGGVLSHCATVAREYGIPCVVGTVVGTTAIRDGMMLAVDGSRGEVRIIGSPE